MRRQVSYQWRLRLVMAEHGMFATTDLVPLLAERSIELSASQVCIGSSPGCRSGCPCRCWQRWATSSRSTQAC